MNKRLSKIGLLLIAIINCLYVYILIRGLLNPNPVTNEKVTEGSQSAIVLSILLILLCIAGIFIKDKHIDKYRKCSEILTVIRLFVGEFGAFWLSFYMVWQKDGVLNPLTIFSEIDKLNLILIFGVILLLISLPVMTHIVALSCFEYGLPKDKRTKNLRIYKILLICLTIVALIGISVLYVLIFMY